MKYDAETFRQFILAYELCTTNEEREAFVIEQFKPIDAIWLDQQQTFIRELNSVLWVQTMGSQIEFPYGKCIHHTARTHQEVKLRIDDHISGVCQAVKSIADSATRERWESGMRNEDGELDDKGSHILKIGPGSRKLWERYKDDKGWTQMRFIKDI